MYSTIIVSINYVNACLVAPPIITKQPIDQSIIALQDVTFAYKAKGFVVKYLWKRQKSSDLIGRRSDLTVYNATPLHED